MSGRTSAEVPDLSKIADYGERILPILNELRESDPIVWNPAAGAWMVLRYEDVVAGYQGKYPLSSKALGAHMFSSIPEAELSRRIPHLMESVPRWFINMDAPEHTRVRTLMMRGFKPSVIESLRPFIQKTVKAALDKAAEKEECEVVDGVLREITIRVIMALIGIPEAHFPDMKEWSNRITDTFTRSRPTGEILEGTDRAFAEMGRIFKQQIDARKIKTTGDFLSHLVTAHDEHGGLSESELVSQLIFLFPAGHDSTTNTMALGLATLLRNRDKWDDFLGSPEKLYDAIMELMRYVAMSAQSLRIAAADFEWHGKRIAKGDAILLMIASANRDPRIYASPEDLDLSRRNDRTLVFGNGAHHCIGHLLAKMEITEFLPEVLRRFPNMEMITETLNFSSGVSFRGLDTLRVRWNK